MKAQTRLVVLWIHWHSALIVHNCQQTRITAKGLRCTIFVFAYDFKYLGISTSRVSAFFHLESIPTSRASVAQLVRARDC